MLQQKQQIVQQQPASLNQPGFHTYIGANIDIIEGKPEPQKPHKNETQSRGQIQDDILLQAADTQQNSGAQNDTNFQKRFDAHQQNSTA